MPTDHRADNIPPSSKPVIIHNETPNRLILKGNDGNVLTLAPLVITQPPEDTDLKQFNLRPLEQKNFLRCTPAESGGMGEAVLGVLVGVAVWYAILGGIFSLVKVKWGEQYWKIGLMVLGAGAILGLLYALWQPLKKIIQIVNQILTVIFMLGIGIGLPAATIKFFGEKSDDLPFLGRILQWVFILAASVLPGLLYFLFDRQCLSTMRRRFEQSIFRLDPTISTLTDVRAKYGQQLEEIYGPEDARAGRAKLNPRGTNLPMLVATVLITFGWVITLAPVGQISLTDSKDLASLFIPQKSALAFGFLGAYFFSLQDILRRYIRRDLKPKAYSSICVRILIVSILAWIIISLPKAIANDGQPNSIVLALIFLVGIFPETGLTYIRESVRPLTGKLLNVMDEKHPLTNLDGVDLYDRTRLLDEGVTNIEALAHHDFVDLMIETRIPVPRLVDLVDQAILQLHVSNTEENTASNLLARLRTYGIRTATDLLRVEELNKTGQLNNVLQTLAGEGAINEVNRLQIIIQALTDDEWLNCIKNWRAKVSVEEIILEAKTSPAALSAVA